MWNMVTIGKTVTEKKIILFKIIFAFFASIFYSQIKSEDDLPHQHGLGNFGIILKNV